MITLIFFRFLLFFQLSVTDIKFMPLHFSNVEFFFLTQLLLLMPVFSCDRYKTSPEILSVLISLAHRLVVLMKIPLITRSGQVFSIVRISK